MRSTEIDLAVIGGGAAGLLAAGIAASRGVKVSVIEKNRQLGMKLGITGKGRCKVTNDATPQDVINNTTTNGKFLYSSVNAFPPRAVMDFFQSIGVPLKTERGGRVFPVSDRARDVVYALRDYATSNGVSFVQAEAKGVEISEGAVSSVLLGQGSIRAKNVLIATGGVSYPATGSTGDGYKFARALGHTVKEPVPSLVPLVASGNICGRMQGLSLKNVGISIVDKSGKLIYTDQGEMLFTHFGISGPMILSASAHMRDYSAAGYKLIIDMKPALDEKKLNDRLLRDFAAFSNRDYSNYLSELVPHSMIPVIVDLSGIPADKKVNSITKEQRRALIQTLKGITIPILRPRPIEEAIVTSGGVCVKEINPKTMESKLVRGLYFAGEVIDVDAYTGGFNLQIAWSTAYAAASAISEGGDR